MKKVSLFAVMAVNFVVLGGGIDSLADTAPAVTGLTCEMIQKQDVCGAFKSCTWNEVLGCKTTVDPTVPKDAPKGRGTNTGTGGG